MNVLNFEKPGDEPKTYRVEVQTLDSEEHWVYEGCEGVSLGEDDGLMWIAVSETETVMFNLANIGMVRVTEEA